VNENEVGPAAEPHPCYRMEVEGEIGPEWADWFGADALLAADGRTSIELRVVDQAQLHGVLRRVHGLHLQVVSLTRIEEGRIHPGDLQVAGQNGDDAGDEPDRRCR
jgi:hypothetical protein